MSQLLASLQQQFGPQSSLPPQAQGYLRNLFQSQPGVSGGNMYASEQGGTPNPYYSPQGTTARMY